MKALQKLAPEPGAEYADAPERALEAGELRLKVHRASICGSDLPIFHWNSWAPQRLKLPMVFGHEFCGFVTQVGPKVKGFKKGDFVSVESHIYCGTCSQCSSGQKHVCESMKIIGIDGPGGFAETAIIPARCAWKHKGAALRDLGSLMEPFGNAVYSVLVEPVKDQNVLVTGCGPQGLFSIAVARAGGAKRVTAVEGSAFRAKLARKMGADQVVDPESPEAAKLHGKFDAVMEMSGAAPAIALAFRAVRSGGRITAFGIPSRRIEIDWGGELIFKGVRVHGIVGRRIWDTWETGDKLLRSGKVDLAAVVTHVYPLKDFEKGFAVMSSPEKKCGKVLFVP
jgi:threonine 3-dehydrogenase